MDTPLLDRYQRQMLLPEWGTEGQQRLLQARVLVVGAGGLGCPALLYLAAAGVGTLGIVDHDEVALHNLHRQVLYAMSDIGRPKARCAAERLQALNPDIQIRPYLMRLDRENALTLLEYYDVVIDATDHFPTRYLLSDACTLLQKPLIYGAVSQWEAQVALLCYPDPHTERLLHYRDLFPEPPGDKQAPNCAENGVPGVLPGITGMLQATLALQVLTGIGTPLTNLLQTFQMNRHQWLQWEIAPHPDAERLRPKDRAAFLNTDYAWDCALPPVEEIDSKALQMLIATDSPTLVDVREYGETPVPGDFPFLQIPLSELNSRAGEITGPLVVVFCQTGIRSETGARRLMAIFPDKHIVHLRRGILGWNHFQQQYGQKNT